MGGWEKRETSLRLGGDKQNYFTKVSEQTQFLNIYSSSCLYDAPTIPALRLFDATIASALSLASQSQARRDRAVDVAFWHSNNAIYSRSADNEAGVGGAHIRRNMT